MVGILDILDSMIARVLLASNQARDNQIEKVTDRDPPIQFPCGRVKRFLKNNTQNKMRVGAKGMPSLPPTPSPQLQRPKS